jgi:leucyl aminopeptidase
MRLALENQAIHEIQSDCLVIGFTEGGAMTPSARRVDEVSGGAIGRWLESRDIHTAIGKTQFLHGVPGLAAPRVLAVGFGKQDKLDLPASTAPAWLPARRCAITPWPAATSACTNSSLAKPGPDSACGRPPWPSIAPITCTR